MESNIRNSDPVRTDQTLPPPVSSFSESMVCDTNKRSSEVLRAKVVDSFTHEPLDLVRVGFTIPDQDECEMGVTDDSGELDKSYPEVYGGMMSFMKEDYLTSFYPIDTYDLPPSQNLIGYAVADIKEPVIELHKLKPINVTVQKKRISKCIIPLECFYTVGAIGLIPYKDITCKEAERRCFFDSKDSNTLFNSNPASSGPTSGSSGLFELPDHLLRKQVNDSLTKYNDYYFSETETSLSDDEDVLVVLRKVSDLNNGPMTEDQTIPIFINGPRSTEVKLVPGIYAVDAMLTLKKEINIATEERSVAFTIITWEKDFRYTLNGSKLEKFISGSLKWDEPKYYFEITPEELYTSDQLTFYVPSYAIEDVPLQVEVSSWECAAVVFGYPAAGCREKSVKVNGRLMEDLMMMTDMSQISKEKRKSLDPLWN
ncbi:hypothetical protein HYT52_01715 [Candidatus Woesearchaeota archaeon]|nr:hypothetical protein [Candidatus Woesearchaeota archaeon]